MSRILITGEEIESELVRLTRTHEEITWAVAWATSGFKAANVLVKHRDKIRRLVVGTHFHQTDPEFMAHFVGDERVRFVLNPAGVFHPKLYFFSTGARWEAVVGSPNFTAGAMSVNTEIAVLLSEKDSDDDVRDSLLRAVEQSWTTGSVLTADDLKGYRVLWTKSGKRLKQLAGKFPAGGKKGSPKGADDGGLAPLETPILRMPWDRFMASVRSDDFHSLDGRREILRHFREWFGEHEHFQDFTLEQRQRVAGITPGKSQPDWKWFGSMLGAGVFKKLINENSEGLSAALDEIPLAEPVTREQYEGFVRHFRLAFKDESRGGEGLATATRLLAMKRPDVFVCVDSKNKEQLCAAFGIPKSLDFERYWARVIRRIRESAWWLAPEPTDPIEREVWLGRAAFLDALYYEGTGNE